MIVAGLAAARLGLQRPISLDTGSSFTRWTSDYFFAARRYG